MNKLSLRLINVRLFSAAGKQMLIRMFSSPEEPTLEAFNGETKVKSVVRARLV